MVLTVQYVKTKVCILSSLYRLRQYLLLQLRLRLRFLANQEKDGIVGCLQILELIIIGQKEPLYLLTALDQLQFQEIPRFGEHSLMLQERT